MLPALQPSRPKVHSPHHQNPPYQQQTRTLQSQSAEQQTAGPPRNQIEAMPPSSTPPIKQQAAMPMYNPAVTHPVFFTETWRKPPFPLPFNAGFSPVAAGYAFGNNKPRAGSPTKL
ncbi:hypothetical protein LTR36_004287 [Oleoguttula mirabilis]|uniref:Uncharacterized protein n=1 Tax=Oleoguttula mirabilis TaxID=1507867 RepID=A0AAV9JIS2_9PEZI|nr:hypothetical protein LTR36_004287 [Oleoguttula mirabilis]